MTTITFQFANSNPAPIFIQVDPFAGVYRLNQGEQIEIGFDADVTAPAFDIRELKDLRIVTLLQSDSYFIVRDGRRIPWTEFSSNFDL
jgi:hypothetical protein